ncbi:MAG: phosphotransferase [Saprospiraceae bacterium]|jgi:5-methylthioribose kinase|nr:phosphotransferase [Saprospiraceae bacterium]
MIILNASEPLKLADYLRSKRWLHHDETIRMASIPGEGNMNFVLRIDTGYRSFIVKQSKDYVEKYPHVAAPADRIVTEGAFYRKVSGHDTLQEFMPLLLGIDIENNVLVLEDLGNSRDFTRIYHKDEFISDDELIGLVHYLSALHESFFRDNSDAVFANKKMKILNHEHIFCYPFQKDNGFDLNTITPGLQEVAIRYKTDGMLKTIVSKLGECYLSEGNYLLHGDFYPGSWLLTKNGIKVIDPEFCFYGSREFDLAIMQAHLILARQNQSVIDLIAKHYDAYDTLNKPIIRRMTGTEIMRRLIGLAQLPLDLSLDSKKQLLEQASQMIKQ